MGKKEKEQGKGKFFSFCWQKEKKPIISVKQNIYIYFSGGKLKTYPCFKGISINATPRTICRSSWDHHRLTADGV
jgi:hypothetical protein